MTPHEQMLRMVSGYWISQAVYVAAKLGIADLVKDGPRSAEDLAGVTSTHAPSLYRLLRALASVGVFAEDGQRRFGLTPTAECLRSDLPGSQRGLAVMNGEEHYRAYGDLLYSVQTGKPGFDRVYGMPVFDFLSRHPEQARTFDEAMVGVHGRETAAMVEAFDLSGVKVLADVGGGNGSLLTAVLMRYKAMRGVLFDLPGVIERARKNIEAAGLQDRCQCVAGNFFESVAGGADAYLLRHIIHDWDDEKSTQILKNVHAVLPAGGRVLVVENVIEPGNAPAFGKLLDLTMLVLPGGKERTEEEYRALFAGAGFRLSRVVPTKADVSVIEGVKG
jgi:predicted O-methyltransferase YrrM